MHRILWLVFAAITFFHHPFLQAREYCADTGGYCYEDCRRASCVPAAIALGTLAIVAIVAVAVQNTGSGHCGHDDSSSSTPVGSCCHCD